MLQSSKIIYALHVLFFFTCSITDGLPSSSKRPNVILIMTDDQGYSNLGCQGHPVIKTPNIDKFAENAIQLTNFHQEILCSPSRSALMTGRYSARTGAWRTAAGRSIMKDNETTLAELFKSNGYKTAHMGKWHLGTNYPFRSMDQGFDEVVSHKSGGIGQIADYWGNDYFDDTYYHNGEPTKYKGYCADVWFNKTIDFIDSNKDNPFFVYLASNTPHSPYIVSEKYYKPYIDQNVPEKRAKYYGMITNLDDNMGNLLKYLNEEGLADNTIIVFTTDDGASGTSCNTHDGSVDGFPTDGYNAGLRGRKASVYEGGHRTFCFWKWPNGNLTNHMEIDQLTGVWDIFPTLADLCNIKIPKHLNIDGKSLTSLLYARKNNQWPDRTLFVQLHGGVGLKYLPGAPHPFQESAIMKGPWRLINGKELYHIDNDRRQEHNIALQYPEIVKELRNSYNQWFKSTTKDMNIPCRTVLGDQAENPLELSAQEMYTSEGNSPASAKHAINLERSSSPWKVHIAQSGKYMIKASRYPVYSNIPMGIKASSGKQDLNVNKVTLRIGSKTFEKHATSNDAYAEFSAILTKGDNELQGFIIDQEGKKYPTYFVLVEKVKSNTQQ
ncbi:N-acetylgalactosamine-4-sulfatase precursor [Puteibacter caeruleilacunae]|nr:N-acetylgalactosamine-4-sulfatase precursor [Puteibacter caeruleilacunae]